MKRSLTLKKETLAELRPDELRSIAAGDISLSTCLLTRNLFVSCYCP